MKLTPFSRLCNGCTKMCLIMKSDTWQNPSVDVPHAIIHCITHALQQLHVYMCMQTTYVAIVHIVCYRQIEF